MQLTDEQIDAAQALGCRFIPASDAQVRQFSMQRRIFQIHGKPYLAARADGFYETAGTLLALILEARPKARPVPPPAPAEEAPEPAAEQPALSAREAAGDDPAPAETAPEPEDEETEAAAPAAPEPAAASPARPPSSPAPLSRAPAQALPAGAFPPGVADAMTTITKGFLRKHQLDAAELTTLLTTLHRSLRGLPRG